MLLTKSLLLFCTIFAPPLFVLPYFASGSKILFLLPLASTSHLNVFQPLIHELADRGHYLTVVSPQHNSKSKNYTNIHQIAPFNFSRSALDEFGDPFKRRSEGRLAMFFTRFNFMAKGCHQVYQNDEFLTTILYNGDHFFDLVFVNAYMNDCIFGLLAKLKAAPLFIILSTVAATNDLTSHVGNRLPPSFVPALPFDFSDSMNFVQRLTNFVFNAFVDGLSIFVTNGHFETIYRHYLGQDLPDLNTILGSASLIFMNSHFALSYPRPILPDVIEVGGMHCRPAKKLPKDIEEFLSGGKDGFIYFSLGSTVQAKTMPENVRNIFVTVFSRLKQRVLWKWETGEMANLTKNVKLLPWADQQDILGHKNLKMFITHGGLLSTMESVYHGVPLVGIPIFGDQNLNMAKAERAGYALRIEIMEITENKLEKTIHRILNEKQFSEAAKELSAIFRDQRETPLDRAVFWTEYCLRRKGAGHLKSAARNLNFFQYHSLDTLATICLVVMVSLWILKIVILGITRKLWDLRYVERNKVNSK